MSAPVVANRLRKASGIWSRKSLRDGWLAMLGQIAAYIKTIRTIATNQLNRLRRWSLSVLARTLCSIVLTRPVVGEERLLQLCLGAREVPERMPAQRLHDLVQCVLGSTARQSVVGHNEVAHPRKGCEL